MQKIDVIIIGAGAAGMLCAIEAGKRGRSVLLLEKSKNPGEKIRISGGGRCNFTNLDVSARNYISQNPKFSISALSRFTPADFVALLAKYDIAWHEKTLGQLFCDGSAKQIVAMLLNEMSAVGVQMKTSVELETIAQTPSGFEVHNATQSWSCQSLVIACGGKSIPKMGATKFGYAIAEQFGLKIVPTEPALVPFTLEPGQLERTKLLSGVGVKAIVNCAGTRFEEAVLFTHRGLSGPAILQISSYWTEGACVEINWAPTASAIKCVQAARQKAGKQELGTTLAQIVPKKLSQMIAENFPGRIADLNDRQLREIDKCVHAWSVKPSGTEGYRTAEVTRGGVYTNQLSAKTMAAKTNPNLYFIGEVVDMTGWLGGYNFQWAWSSGWAAGQAV